MAQQYAAYGSYENEYGREYIYPNGRMYVHSSVRLPNSEVDLRTGMLKPEADRRGRTQAMRMEYEALEREHSQINEAFQRRMNQSGFRLSLRAAVLLLVATACVLLVMVLAQQGTLVERQKSLSKITKQVETAMKSNALIADEIAEASKATAVCYAAARDLKMIPSEAAEAIHLLAADTRPMETRVQYATSAGNNAQETSVEATMVPSIASAGQGY